MAKKKPQYPNRKRNIIITTAVSAVIILALVSIGVINHLRTNYIFTLNGERASVREYRLYLFWQRGYFEEQFGMGSSIWNYGYNETTSFYELACQMAVEDLLTTKLVNSKASELGVSASDEDKASAKQLATEFVDNMNAGLSAGDVKFLQAFKMTHKQLTQTMLEDIIVAKVYDHLTSGYELVEADFQTEYATYLEEQKLDYLTVNVNYIKVEDLTVAREVQAKLTAGEDFTELLKEYSVSYNPDAETDPLAPVSLATLALSDESLERVLTLVEGDISNIEDLDDGTGHMLLQIDSITEPDYAELEESLRGAYIDDQKLTIYDAKCKEWRDASEFTLNEKVYINTAIPGLTPVAQ